MKAFLYLILIVILSFKASYRFFAEMTEISSIKQRKDHAGRNEILTFSFSTKLLFAAVIIACAFVLQVTSKQLIVATMLSVVMTSVVSYWYIAIVKKEASKIVATKIYATICLIFILSALYHLSAKEQIIVVAVIVVIAVITTIVGCSQKIRSIRKNRGGEKK